MGAEEVGGAAPGPAWELSRGWRQVHGWQPGPRTQLVAVGGAAVASGLVPGLGRPGAGSSPTPAPGAGAGGCQGARGHLTPCQGVKTNIEPGGSSVIHRTAFCLISSARVKSCQGARNQVMQNEPRHCCLSCVAASSQAAVTRGKVELGQARSGQQQVGVKRCHYHNRTGDGG